MLNDLKPSERVMVILLEKEVNFLLSSSLAKVALRFSHQAFWGSLPTTEIEARKRHVFVKGGGFYLTGCGNCSGRATDAAMKLYHVLKDTEVKVILYSAPSIDQFIVYLKTPDKRWHVYDPLTNPELLFSVAEYKEEIIPLFTKVPHPAREIKLTIDRDLYDSYLFFCPRLKKCLTDACMQPWDNAMHDESYVLSATKAGIDVKQLPSLTREAHDALARELTVSAELEEPRPSTRMGV